MSMPLQRSIRFFKPWPRSVYGSNNARAVRDSQQPVSLRGRHRPRSISREPTCRGALKSRERMVAGAGACTLISSRPSGRAYNSSASASTTPASVRRWPSSVTRSRRTKAATRLGYVRSRLHSRERVHHHLGEAGVTGHERLAVTQPKIARGRKRRGGRRCARFPTAPETPTPRHRLLRESGGFEGLLLVVVVPQPHDPAVAELAEDGVVSAKLDPALPPRDDHSEERDHLVIARGKEFDPLDPPTLPARVPAGQPFIEGVSPRRFGDVLVVDLDLGINLGRGGLVITIRGCFHPPTHHLHVLLRHRRRRRMAIAPSRVGNRGRRGSRSPADSGSSPFRPHNWSFRHRIAHHEPQVRPTVSRSCSPSGTVSGIRGSLSRERRSSRLEDAPNDLLVLLRHRLLPHPGGFKGSFTVREELHLHHAPGPKPEDGPRTELKRRPASFSTPALVMDDYNLILASFAELDRLENELVPGVRVIAPELDHCFLAVDDPLVTGGHRADVEFDLLIEDVEEPACIAEKIPHDFHVLLRHRLFLEPGGCESLIAIWEQ